MLHGELPPPNNFPGANSINEDLKKSQLNAKLWHSDAYLANFSYYTDPGSMDDHEIKFSLQKNNENKLLWTITFTNYYAKKSYIVKVDTDKIQNPIFNIFTSDYVKPYWEN